MGNNVHLLSKDVQTEIKGQWVPAIPYPYFTTKGLPFWKRLSEKHWRPQCLCGRIFDSEEDYEAHIVYMNTPYATARKKTKKG